MISPYKLFNKWLFDGSLKTSIPLPKFDNEGKVLVPDLLKYNSPISHTYLIKIFVRNGPLNHYLNTYFNNISLRYLSKEDLFKFIKKAVIDFRVKQRDITFFPYKQKDVLFEKLRSKLPILNNNDLSLLCDLVMKSSDKGLIYATLGLEKPKKKKIRQTKRKVRKKSLNEFLQEHFSIQEK